MATTFTWKISQLERETQDGFVFVAHYVIDASNGTCNAGAYGSIGLERPEDKLIPFDSLTEEIVIGWVKDKLTAEKVAEVEAALQAQLDEKHAVGLPWAG